MALTACGEPNAEGGATARGPAPAPKVTLTAEDKEVWAPLPPDRSAIPVLLYHGIGPEDAFSDESDAAYGVSAGDFAKQMTLLAHAGYETVTLEQFVRFVRGDDVSLPPRPLLLTFDDARADSWTGGDGILRDLGFNAVMFVDVAPVEEGRPEYLTWTELDTARRSGRWVSQLHAGRGHHRIRYGIEPDETGPFYAYEERGESFDEWQDRAFSDIEWGEQQIAEHTPGYEPLAFAPPFGAYGQEGTNDERIPDALLGWLKKRFDVIFTQDRNAFAHKGAGQPLGRIQVTRATTGGELHALLTASG